MKTYNEIITNLEQIKKVADDIICDVEVIFELTIPYKDDKSRNYAKKLGFTFDWNKKVWTKKTNRCEWRVSSFITNIYKA